MNTKTRYAAVALAGLTLIGAGTPASATTTLVTNEAALRGLTIMREINLFVAETWTTGHEVEGKAWVGGSTSGNTYNVGIGNGSQGATGTTYKTLTIGGTSGSTININNGTNGAAGTQVSSGASYGVTIKGDSAGFNVNASGATVRIGGNYNGGNELKIQSSTGGTTSGSVYVHGSVNTVIVGDNSTIKAGTVTGKAYAGNNSTIAISSGNLSELKAGDNSTVKIGGSTSSLQLGNGSNATISGNVGQNLNLGQNDAVLIGGQFQSQNVNGLPNGTTVKVSGASQSQNGAPNGWTFNTGAAYPAPDVPTVADDIAGQTATMLTDLKSLSTQIKNLAPGNTTQITTAGTKWAFNLGSAVTGLTTPTVTNAGYSVFNINGADLQGATEIAFNLGGITAPIVVNVTGNMTWNANFEGTNLAWLNQNVIWNFTDATKVDFKKQIHGSVLATLAEISNVTPIEGSVVARSFVQGGEVHLGTYASTDRLVQNVFHVGSGAVPEPATWAQMIVGFGLVGALRRRRRSLTAAAAI